MENQEIELTRFRRKARGYRAALELAPQARILEVLAIACILEGFRRRKELSRSEFTVVDLMAGTGFLSEQLHQLGFRNVHAFEACNDMSQSPPGQHDAGKHFTLHPFASVEGIEPLLKSIRPHAVVALAGFHHLIQYESDRKTVNVDASTALQERVVKTCMEALGTDGMLLIVDIYDDIVERPIPESWPYWCKANTVGSLPNGAVIPQAIKKSLLEANTFHDFSETIERHLCSIPSKSNPSLGWFRSVVDQLSSTGHKDVALNKQLLDDLSAMYRVTFGTTPCPWLFENSAILQKFVVTFWFDAFSHDSQKVQEIVDKAEKVNGLHANTTFASFGWNLGYAILEARSSHVGTVFRAARRRMTILLWILLTLSAINISFKLFTYWSSLYSFLDKIVPAILGILGNEVWTAWKRRSEKENSGDALENSRGRL
jgi:hypothetical protein